MSRTLIAIPALNEAATIGSVIDEVRAVVPDAQILVVDDGSADATADVAADHGARVLRMPFNVGVGAAMRAAFRFALINDHDALVQVDADGQHIAAHIPTLLAGLDEANVVIGSRFRAGEPYRVPRMRRAAMHVLASALGRVCGTTLTDTTSGFRAADRRAIALFAEHYPAEYLGDTVESLVIAARAGLHVREVQVEMRPRQGGAASHSSVRSALHLGRSLLALYATMARTPARALATAPEQVPA